jgi:hypothetical protein
VGGPGRRSCGAPDPLLSCLLPKSWSRTVVCVKEDQRRPGLSAIVA